MPRQDNDSQERERRFFEDVAARGQIRVAARALILHDDHVLLQRMAHSGSFWCFPGGELELGEALEEGLRRELIEETTLQIRTMVYRFAANNRFEQGGARFHFVEHYFEVVPASIDVASLEDGHVLQWHPITRIGSLDIRPWGVRDILALSGWRNIRLLEVE